MAESTSLTGELQRVVRYWYECIKTENALEKDISIAVKNRAILYPFKADPYICTAESGNTEQLLDGNDERVLRFVTRAAAESLDTFFGYPILCFEDEDSKKTSVAPLLVIRVRLKIRVGKISVNSDETLPAFGVQALGRLGARTEEVADFNRQIPEAIAAAGTPSEIAKRLLSIVESQFEIPFAERIEPDKLTNDRALQRGGSGLYNKSILFAGEPTAYNMHLLADLEELKSRTDLQSTALALLLRLPQKKVEPGKPPILAFSANEFQIDALQRALANDATVITGPPGTGKSQLISNLLLNIVYRRQSCLFVSHTNEAINIVNAKLNGDFPNVVTRTGSKSFRQELRGRFNELLAARTPTQTEVTERTIKERWQALGAQRSQLLLRDSLETEVFNATEADQFLRSQIVDSSNVWRATWLKLRRLITRASLRWLVARLRRMRTRIELETAIHESQQSYVAACHKFVSSSYVTSLVGDARGVGAVHEYLAAITGRGYGDTLDPILFMRAAQSLRIWCSTLKSVRASFPLQPRLFDYVIFDEASQVDLPSAAPALYRARRAIIVGDPMQLSHITSLTPDVDRALAIASGLANGGLYPKRSRYLDVSLYAAAERSLTERPILLANHYRSDDQIISLCNRVFYGGQLRVRTDIDATTIPSEIEPGVHWIDCEGIAERHPNGSRVNEREVNAVAELAKRLVATLDDRNTSIGIVTPYSRQQAAIYEAVSGCISEESIQRHSIKILTAHKFQGSEKDIMIFSVVLAARGNAGDDRWYNMNPQLINVGLSRARFALYIVGDRSYCLSRHGILGRIASTYESQQAEGRVAHESLRARFDTVQERLLFEALERQGSQLDGYSLVLKPVVGRYTLDMALMGRQNLDIECDGSQHEIVGGLPVIEDVERDRYLSVRNWKVFRVPNYRITSDPNVVAREIVREVTGVSAQ